jgi:hypothetical protein
MRMSCTYKNKGKILTSRRTSFKWHRWGTWHQVVTTHRSVNCAEDWKQSYSLWRCRTTAKATMTVTDHCKGYSDDAGSLQRLSWCQLKRQLWSVIAKAMMMVTDHCKRLPWRQRKRILWHVSVEATMTVMDHCKGYTGVSVIRTLQCLSACQIISTF